MTQSSTQIDVYLEFGTKRAFAGAVDWPGWCRSGRDESALQALFDCGPRYAGALRAARLGFRAPADPSAFVVVERLAGDAATDFGAPGGPLQRRAAGRRSRAATFPGVAQGVLAGVRRGRTGRRGERAEQGAARRRPGLDAIIQHVLGGDASLSLAAGLEARQSQAKNAGEELSRTRQAILDALAAGARGELPARGPRGGVIWTPRYFVRRVAWHALDHAWEIEDRAR